MVRQQYVWVVVGMAVLAGCVGGLGGGAADGGGSGADDGAGAGVADDADATGADGTDASARGDGDRALVENRTAVLRAAGSFTSVWQLSVTTDGDLESETTYTSAVDYVDERTHFRMQIVTDDEVRTDFETFYADGRRYQRIGSGEEVSYASDETVFSPDTSLFSAEANIYSSGDLDEFTDRGTETFDGVTVTRYERTERPVWLSNQARTDGAVRWTEFTYTVLVDENGLVRSESWTSEGIDDEDATVTMTFSYSVTAVGSTVVDEPDWVDSARADAKTTAR